MNFISVNEGKLRFWCQKVLPLTYDDSLSYYELLDKVVKYLNNVIEDMEKIPDFIIEEISKLADTGVNTVQELLTMDIDADTYVDVKGYNTVGDGGDNLYYVTTDYSLVQNEPFFLTFTGTAKWAIPILIKPYVKPEMFGGMTGEYDNTDAFEICMEYPRRIELNEGVYSMTGIDVPENKIIKGHNTTLRQLTDNKAMLTLTGDNISISGITFDPNPEAQTQTNAIIVADGVSNIVIEDCLFMEQKHTAYSIVGSVYFTSCSKVRVENCELTGANGEGMVFGEGCSYCELIGGEYHHNSYGSGVYLYSDTNYCKIINANVHHNQGSNIGVIGNNHIIENCYSHDGGSYGMTIGHPPTGYAVNCQINKCYFGNNTQRDIVVQMSGTKNNKISNSYFKGASNSATNYGVTASSNPGTMIIDNCHFETHRYAIAPYSLWSITNCTFSDNYADIYVAVSGGSTANVYCRDNYSEDATFFVTAGANTSNSWLITGNVCKRIKNSALSFGSCTGNIIVNNQMAGYPNSETGLNITSGQKNQIIGNYFASFKRGIYDLATDIFIGNLCNANSLVDYTITNASVNIGNSNTNGPLA